MNGLSRKEYRLLCALREAQGMATLDYLAAVVWRKPSPDAINALRVLVHRLRRKGHKINSLRGIGYSYDHN